MVSYGRGVEAKKPYNLNLHLVINLTFLSKTSLYNPYRSTSSVSWRYCLRLKLGGIHYLQVSSKHVCHYGLNIIYTPMVRIHITNNFLRFKVQILVRYHNYSSEFKGKKILCFKKMHYSILIMMPIVLFSLMNFAI